MLGLQPDTCQSTLGPDSCLKFRRFCLLVVALRLLFLKVHLVGNEIGKERFVEVSGRSAEQLEMCFDGDTMQATSSDYQI